MTRDRTRTEQRLIDAVGREITENGFDKLGINRISSRAGVNKVLIYRYFGDLNGLVKAYYERTDSLIAAPTLDMQRFKDAPLDDFFTLLHEYFIKEFRLLRKNTDAKEFLKAALLNPGRVYNPTAASEEAELQRQIDALGDIIQLKDAKPFAAIMISAMTVLTLMSQQKRTILGIDLASEEGWQQIEQALKTISRGNYLVTKERLDGTGEELG
jgi:AcrR family transcriptional regulator